MSAAAPAPEGGPTFDLIQHLHRQREFSERTFGPGARTAGAIDHIRKELREIEAAPADLSEWIDVVLLALDGAWRSGASPEAIAAALLMKQTRNEARTWPDWRTADPTKAIEHDRSRDVTGIQPASGSLAEMAAALVQELTPDQGSRPCAAFAKAVALQSALASRKPSAGAALQDELDRLADQFTDLYGTAEKLREALDPFARIASEGVIRTDKGHVTVTTCAEYFHAAVKALATLQAEQKGGAA